MCNGGGGRAGATMTTVGHLVTVKLDIGLWSTASIAANQTAITLKVSPELENVQVSAFESNSNPTYFTSDAGELFIASWISPLRVSRADSPIIRKPRPDRDDGTLYRDPWTRLENLLDAPLERGASCRPPKHHAHRWHLNGGMMLEWDAEAHQGGMGPRSGQPKTRLGMAHTHLEPNPSGARGRSLGTATSNGSTNCLCQRPRRSRCCGGRSRSACSQARPPAGSVRTSSSCRG